MSGVIEFFCEEIEFELSNSSKITEWLSSVIKKANKRLVSINYIFCNDAYLHKINVEYLNHDTYTDIITFDNSNDEDEIESDIFISIERVQDNSKHFSISFEQELHRVMVHGVLHLLGFKDKTAGEQKLMRQAENDSLNQLKPTNHYFSVK